MRHCESNVTLSSHDKAGLHGYYREPMIALLLAFTVDGPELSHDEIDRQIAELECELALERPTPQ